MRTLGLDTAGEFGSVSVLNGSHPVSELTFEARADHGGKLTPALDAALKLAGVARTEIGLIAVSSGPGSFTGLRIGLAFAKGLARAIDCPLVGVPTLESYAERARFWPGPTWVLVPDRRESVYRAVYQGSELVEAPSPYRIDDLIAETTTTQADEEVGPLIIGPGMTIHRSALEHGLPGVHFGSAALAQPSGATVGRLGLERHGRDASDELYELEPLYAQGPPVTPVNHNKRVSA